MLESMGKKSTLNTLMVNVAVLLASLLITITAAEIFLRLTSIGHYSLNRRVLFYSRPSFKSFGRSGVAYEANTAIRNVAIYGDFIEYDTINRTNNLGFFDDVPYWPNAKNANGVKRLSKIRQVAFMGDSFTSGSGGSRPWVSILRDTIQRSDITLFNFGVSGTGVANYLPLLDEVSNNIKVDAANLVLISSDFYRVPWFPLFDDEGIRFCHANLDPSVCLAGSDMVIHHMDFAASRESLISAAQNIYREQNLDRDKNKSFIQSLRVVNLVCDGLFGAIGANDDLMSTCPHLHRYVPNAYEKNGLFKDSVAVLDKIKARYPDVEFRVFHIPEKSELLAGKYSVNVVNELEALKIGYVPLLLGCDFDISMYHKHDGHMNDDGYAYLAECISKYPL